jgi:hypothetical protein
MKRIVKLIFFIALIGCFINCSDSDKKAIIGENEYTIDGVTTEIVEAPVWILKNSTNVKHDYIRFENPNLNSKDLIKIIPITGPSNLEGTYVYSKSDDIGTYDLILSHNWNGIQEFDWTTNGKNGQVLEIKLIKGSGINRVYDISISNFTLDYGHWNFILLT